MRQPYDLKSTVEDNSKRMLNALEYGTIIPIHRHHYSSETMVMVRGKVIECFYDNDGDLTDEFMMAPFGMVYEPIEVPMVQIEAGQWYLLEVLESGTVIFEAKDGAYAPLTEEDILQA